jgi:NADPH2:quinone reductase
MKAWLLDKISSIKSTHLADVPDPTPAPGQVILAVQYAALNPADAYLAEGQYPARPTFPHILGRDAVGTVIALGPNVTGVQVGQQSIVLRCADLGVNRPGTLAQRVAVPAEALVPIPAGWTHQQAAGAALVYMTAYQALTQWDGGPGVGPGPQVVLVTGASGGVGVASVQLAKAMGHTVIGLSRSSDKAVQVKSLGADHVLNPQDPTWPRQLREFLNPADPKARDGRRVDLAIDNIGGDLLPQVIDTLGMWGRVSLVGRLAGPVPHFNTASLFFRRTRIGGVMVGTYSMNQALEAWNSSVALLARIEARPVVDRVFAFEDLHAAFDHLAAGPMGKVLVKIPE